jgi:two-component sensor histidine kinase/thiamine transporter ThiT
MRAATSGLRAQSFKERFAKFVVAARDEPSGALASFAPKKVASLPTLMALALGAIAYFGLAQHWVLYALELWLGYACACLALSVLHANSGVRAGWMRIVPVLVGGAALGSLLSCVTWLFAHPGAMVSWNQAALQSWQPFAYGIIFAGIAVVKDFVASEQSISRRAQQRLLQQQQEGAKQAAEAQLRLLQAQIEPHFLLNTLANVRSLVKRDTTRATEMLDHLSDYLHVALPRMRQTHSTLAREVQLSESFLSIMQIRMGERLKFCFDVPANLGAIVFPPMLLQTLVENSIKHGLEPSSEGGEIKVTAQRLNAPEGERCKVVVTDTGIGFGRANTGGTGIGLANIRERLLSLFGTNASLEISTNTPRGVVATLIIPIESQS